LSYAPQDDTARRPDPSILPDRPRSGQTAPEARHQTAHRIGGGRRHCISPSSTATRRCAYPSLVRPALTSASPSAASDAVTSGMMPYNFTYSASAISPSPRSLALAAGPKAASMPGRTATRDTVG